jgi:hypothetical protein
MNKLIGDKSIESIKPRKESSGIPLQGWLRLAVVLLGFFAAILRLHAAPLTLVADRNTEATIVVPRQPAPLEDFASQDLANYIERMTGAKLDIVREGSPIAKQSVISVGKTTLARGLEIHLPKNRQDDWEAFRILRTGNAIVICGNQKSTGCDLGTLDGVWVFLENLGVGWYAPDPLFEVVPASASLVVDQLDITDAPSTAMRWGGWEPERLVNYEKKEGYLLRGIGSGGRQAWFSHMYDTVVTPEVKKQHPDFMKSGQYCLTNPGLRQLFIDYTKNHLKANPGLYASSLFPDDGEGPACPCDECQKLLKLGKAESTLPRAISKSDYLVEFYNAVAEGISKDYPDRYVVGAVYVGYFDPPNVTRIHPNVIILLAPLTDASELHPVLNGIVAGWRKMGAKQLYWYGYDMGNEPMPNELARRFRNYRRWNLDGVYIEHRPTEAVSGINYYLERKLAWNWDANADDLIQKFSFDLFGPDAGRLMVDFWYAWERTSYDSAQQLIEASEKLVQCDEVRLKRLRFYKLGLEMVTDGRQMDNAIKANNLQGALDAARKCVAARNAINSDYGPGLAYKEYDHHGRYVGGAELMIPLLEKALAFKLPELTPIAPRPGPVRLLTDNADEPAAKRLATGVTVSYDVAPNDPADYAAPKPSKLFNGGLDGGWNNVVGVWGTPDGVWNVTFDLQKPREVDKVEVSLVKTPVYVDVLTSVDGKDFQTVDRLYPRGLDGWQHSRDLGVEARFVRFTLVSTEVAHQIGQVKIWGR